MSGEWQYVTFREVCEHSAFGPRFSSDDYSASGNVACLRVTDIDWNGRINYATMPIAQLDLARFRNHVLQRDDLVITRTGAYLGKAAVFTDFRLPVLPGAFSIRFRVKRDIAAPLFLRYFFNGPEGQAAIQSVATGSAQPNLNIPNLHSLTVPLPPLAEQMAIAGVLKALDDKIELNRRMNETLEALAQSLFKSWFVDATQSALPKGWREGKVSDLATLSRDGLNPGEFPDETFDHYSLPAFDEGRTPKPERGDTIMSNKFIVPPDCVMVSKLNPRIPRIWLPDLRGQNRAVCSTEFLVATPKPGVSREFLYCLFINESFVSVFTTMVTGTSGSHQRVRPESLLNMDTPLPAAPLIQKFTDTVAPMLKRISQNIHESRTLAALRDALLPKLLSGELRVPARNNLTKD